MVTRLRPRPRPAAPPPPGGALAAVVAVAPPLTAASSLMYYFGWARNHHQAAEMGLDVSLFAYTAPDYVLHSVSTLYIPLLVIAGVAAAWLAGHHRLVLALRSPARRPVLRSAGRAVLAFGLGLVLASTLVPGDLLRPLLLAGGAHLAAYGGWLSRAAVGHHAVRTDRVLRHFLVGTVVFLALFWELSEYAGIVGRGKAVAIARSLDTLPRATGYSPDPLGIEAPHVCESRLPTGHRVDGLRLLTRAGGRLFLLHDGWTPGTGTVVVLPDDNRVRWQYGRADTPNPCDTTQGVSP